jgi:hypothetical protein
MESSWARFWAPAESGISRRVAAAKAWVFSSEMATIAVRRRAGFKGAGLEGAGFEAWGVRYGR